MIDQHLAIALIGFGGIFWFLSGVALGGLIREKKW